MVCPNPLPNPSPQGGGAFSSSHCGGLSVPPIVGGLSVPPIVGGFQFLPLWGGFQFLPLWGAKQAELPHGIEQVGMFLTPSPFYGGGLGWGCEVSTCA
jgi:hypothetical protein